MAQIIDFPTDRERFRMRMKAFIEETTSIFDEKTRESLINDMMKFIDLWSEDDQFTATYELDQSEPLSESQLIAIKAAIEPFGEKMRTKTGLLLAELLSLRMRVATCEMLHGQENSQ